MANDNAEIPNPTLRNHVTDQAFVLTLRKTHIAALCAIVNANHDEARAIGTFVTAAGGLRNRGLVEHRWNPNFKGSPFTSSTMSDHWRLTKAGWLIYDLLAEAGLVSAVSRNAGARRLVA